MILSKEVEIRITPSNIKHFNSLGYKNLKCKNKLTVPVEHLSKGSYAIIHVKCDCCNKERYMKYINYSTNIENQGFYACRKCFNIKNKKTNFKKYGDEHYTNREKAKKTNLEINGDEYYNNMKKMKQTNKERFGVEYSLQSKEVREKVKQTNIKKYGCDNPSQNKEVKEKKKQTSLKNFGVKNPMQNPNIFIKSQKSALQRKEHKETGLSYQGTYEKDFLDYCFDNSISIEKGKRIKYIYDGKEHYYFSDFYYEPKNLIIEIKSDWTYNKYLYINLIKEKSCIDSGYDYLFIINKNYIKFNEIIKNPSRFL